MEYVIVRCPALTITTANERHGLYFTREHERFPDDLPRARSAFYQHHDRRFSSIGAVIPHDLVSNWSHGVRMRVLTDDGWSRHAVMLPGYIVFSFAVFSIMGQLNCVHPTATVATAGWTEIIALNIWGGPI
jgi:hypothetical protein